MSKINKILIATHNPAKKQEIAKYLKKYLKKKIDLITLDQLKIKAEPEENGKTIRENSIIKARFYAGLSHLPTLADDGGFFIPFLNGAPGVLSSRWLGKKASDQELIDHTLLKMNGVFYEKRYAYLDLSLCFFDPKSETVFLESEKIEGYIANKPCRKQIPGFPYRAIFIEKKFNKYYDDLTDDEHESVNHRLKAIKRLTKNISLLLV